MNARDFARRRALIERRHAKASKREAAMRRLVRDAGAAVIVHAGKVTGWRLPDGKVVCAKQRYRDQASAETELARIHASNRKHHRVPIRAYPCQHCRGWHLTSQQAQHDHAA